MIADLKPYPAYKESGLPWLGRVPRHWSVSRIKTVLRELDCRSTEGEGTLLSLTRVRGLIPHSDRTDKIHSAKTLVGYKRYQPGEIVMNRMQAWSGMFGAGPTLGLVSPDYAVFKVLGGHETRLVLERLKTPDLVGQFALESKGIGSGFNRLYTDRLGPIPISLPPLDEQVAIVRFLDWANGRLERTIRAKRKVIALLTEQKQAIIHRAVTRGLDPTVPLKPSGIPWLSDIPQHWEVLQVRRVVSFVTSGSRSWANYYSAAGLIFLQSGNLGRAMSLNLSFIQYVRPPAGAEGVRTRVQTNDVLVCITGALTGNVALVDQELCAPAFINQHVALVRPRQHMIQPRFLAYVLHSEIGRTQFKTNEYGGTKQGLGLGDVKNVFLAAPPMEEQRMICAHLDGEVEKFRDAISRLEREIELLREYRTRLVADVVTGKLDVREAASRLPHEIEGQETLGNEAALSEYDEPEEDDPYAVAGETEA